VTQITCAIHFLVLEINYTRNSRPNTHEFCRTNSEFAKTRGSSGGSESFKC